MVEGDWLLDRDRDYIELIVKLAEKIVETKIGFGKGPGPLRIKVVHACRSSVYVVELLIG